ncbi:MAG: PSD1 and planctomycete cytochrome C domain-containing protein [Fuerstiella sp.]
MAGSYCCRPVGVRSRVRCLTVAGWMFLATGGLLCAEDAPTFFRGLNLNGPPVTIDGHLWEGRDSENYTCRDKAFDNQNVPLLPSTDAARAEMIRSSRWGGNRVELKNIPNDSYTVFLYVWEDNNAETYSISVNDREVQSRYNSGVTGHWDRLGPWYVDATTSQIVIASSGGTANFSGVEIWRGRHDGVYAEPLKPEDLAFFESRIRPLLVKHCYECHSAEADELQAALLVDSQPMLRRGGVTGPAVVPGDVEHSLLIEAVRYENEDMQMPPDGKLAAAEIADLERWVSIGAPDPRHTAARFVRRTIDVEEARKFWSLRPLTEPVVPAVRDTSWPFSDIDRFIMARLEQQQLDPVGLADKRTLIRRVSFDLTGLPPSPDQVEAFLADESPEAFERIVNQLLESPRYGEYWGRHWMDLVRYADTAGDNSDYPVPQAYLYRNYIIDSFNADKPYDQFLCEQIAGDLLPAENEAQRNEQLIATGYLAISRRFGSVIQDYPQHLTIEDTIDNLGRTVLGLTISCARCHNHKFDPVSQDDYYALYGIFNSTRYPFPGIELDKKPRDFVPLVKNGKPSDQLAYAVAEGTAADAPLQLRGEPSKPGDVVPRRFLEVLGGQLLPDEAVGQSGRLQLAEWLTAADNPLTPRVMVNRLWQYHFGSGLVRTPSDFGRRGQAPTHPELLDWLARCFVADGWSIKQLHRRMLLSRVYQLDSKDVAEESTTAVGRVATVDPNNELRARFSRRRLDAESLRDTLLLLSGELNETMPREPHPFPPADKWQYTQHHPFRDSYETNHRSVYLMTARLNARPFFTTFDGADRNASTAVRDSSVTTVQSLYFLNDEFVHARAEKFAARLLSERSDEKARLVRAFELTLSRPPTADEQSSALAWFAELQQQLADSGTAGDQREIAAWTSFARVLFRLNEFLYVD